MTSLFSTISSPVEVTVGELVDGLGARTVVALGSGGYDAAISGVEFYDASDPLPEQPGLLLIVPSAAHYGLADLAALIGHAAAQGCAALALKCDDAAAAGLATAAKEHGLPVLRVGERVGWRLFDAMVGSALGPAQGAAPALTARGAEPLFVLANDLAREFGGSVAIEDLGRRIVAYSAAAGQMIDSVRTEGILARRVPDSPVNDEQYQAVLRSDEPVSFAAVADELPRFACAVRAGTMPLGTIWIIDGSGRLELTGEQSSALQRAAHIAAAHMLDDIRVREAGQAPREETLRSLLSGQQVTGGEFAELGISARAGAQLLAVEPGGGADPSTLAQLRAAVHRHLGLYRAEVVSVVRSARVYALVQATDAPALQRMLDSLLPALAQLVGVPASGAAVRVAVPGSAQRPDGVPALRALADRLLDTSEQFPDPHRGPLLTVSNMRPLMLFARLHELFSEDPSLNDPAVAALQAEQPVLASAVLHWCEAFGNVARAAAAAGVHENTIRYRIRRAQERHGVRLDTPDTLVATWLQLRSELPAAGTSAGAP